jgi:preflagellin peptidase FlaK
METYYIPLLAAIIAVLACVYASYSDIKRGIIPNKLTFPLIGVGLVLDGIYAYLTGNYWLIISAALITGFIFVLGYLFWKMGAWAGGDVKLFTALAALLPIYPPLFAYNILSYQMPIYANYPFPFTLIINSILSMLPFLLIYVFYISFKYKTHLLKELIAPVKNYQKNIITTLVVTAAAYITLQITPYLPFQIIIISLILIFILSYLISKLPLYIKAVIIIVTTVLGLWQNYMVTISGIVILFLIITFIEMVRILLTRVSKEALQDDYKINELSEGMIAAHKLYEKDDKVFYDDKSFYQKIREAISTGDLSIISTPPGKLLVGTLAAGLKNEDIELLKKLSHEGKISDNFKVKKGVPFAPSILIGLLISLLIGDLAIIFLNILNWILY